MYIAVKGGEAAIEASRRLLQAARRGDPAVPALRADQVGQQLGLLVDRVMAEASLYDPGLAAVALLQAQGDVTEAAFLLRAYRTTLPRLGHSEPLALSRMRVERRVSAIFKDLPGGQVLGPTVDYTQRLIDLPADETGPLDEPAPASGPDGLTYAADLPDDPEALLARFARELEGDEVGEGVPDGLSSLVDEGLVEPARPSEGDPAPPDVTRDPPRYPLPRAGRLQMLARADEGWVLGLGYATQRGYAHTHPFAGDVRLGVVPVTVRPDELDVAVEIGEARLTECQMLNQFTGSAEAPPQFTRGYGLVFGHGERKAMAMALVDRTLRADEFGERVEQPSQDQEFVLPQGDSIESSGFVQHLKLPHYVTFESELQLVRQLREDHRARLHAQAASDAEATAHHRAPPSPTTPTPTPTVTP
jgi:alpha-D-ribose 1-methylphosphonate 5-triphosphate synthase subunit PhnI